jgi:probable rRNA maturation factor
MSPAARPTALVVDVAADGVRIPLARARVAAAAREVLHGEGIRNALVSITFVTRARIAALNRKHLGHRGATDVITFGFRRPTPGDPVVGDVYIAPDVARATAQSLGVGVREELTRLVVHGTLHVLGHEHPEEDDRERSPMWVKQEGILRRVLTTAAPPRKRRVARAATRRRRAQ